MKTIIKNFLLISLIILSVLYGFSLVNSDPILPPLNIQTEDGTVNNYPWSLHVTPTPMLIDNGDGTMTLKGNASSTSAGGGATIPAGPDGALQFKASTTPATFGGSTNLRWYDASSTPTLLVNGNLWTTQQFISTLAAGTAPFAVTSNTLNTNLNADLWDGYQFSDYLNQSVKTDASPTHVGMTLSGMTAGSVLFAGTGGVVSQDNANFFWDNTNNRLGIGTASPSVEFDMDGAAIFNISEADKDFRVATDDDTNAFRIDGGTGALYFNKTTSNSEWDSVEINATHDDYYLFGLQSSAVQKAEGYWVYGMSPSVTRQSAANSSGTTYGLDSVVTFKPEVTGTTDSGEAIGSRNSIYFNCNALDGSPACALAKTGDTIALQTYYYVNFDNSSSDNDWTVSNLYDYWGKGLGIGSKAGDTFTVTTWNRFYINDGTESSATNAARLSIGTYAGLKIDALDSNITITGAQRGIVLNGDITAGSTTALGGGIVFGVGQDASIGYDNTNLVIDPNLVGSGVVQIGTATDRLGFRDSAIYINSIDDGHLDLTADTSVDINSALYVSGTTTLGTLNGIIKGTTGVLSAITDNSTNWDTAYTHSQDDTTDVHNQFIFNIPTADTRNVIQPSASTVKGLVLKGAASQSDNWLESTDSSGNIINQWGASSVVFNEQGSDIDFRAKGDTDANLFTLDAGYDTVGIGVAASLYRKLNISSTANNNDRAIGFYSRVTQPTDATTAGGDIAATRTYNGGSSAERTYGLKLAVTAQNTGDLTAVNPNPALSAFLGEVKYNFNTPVTVTISEAQAAQVVHRVTAGSWGGGTTLNLTTLVGYASSGFDANVTPASGDTINIANLSHFKAYDSILTGDGGVITLTNNIGLNLTNLSVGTNNTNILVGTGTTGNWSIYNNSTYDNFFAGIIQSSNIVPRTNDTYYLGKNDDDTPLAYKGVILKDTTNGKYYRIEIINGVITATDLTD